MVDYWAFFNKIAEFYYNTNVQKTSAIILYGMILFDHLRDVFRIPLRFCLPPPSAKFL